MVNSLKELLYISGLQYLENATEISLGYNKVKGKKYNIIFDNTTTKTFFKIKSEKIQAFGSSDSPVHISGNTIYFFNIPKTIESYLLCNLSEPSKPIVDIVGTFFRESVINFLRKKDVSVPVISPLPEDLPVIFVSHDIDLLRYSKIYNILRPGRFRKISDYIALFDLQYDRYWNIDKIIQWEKENSIRSTYFFITRSRDKHARRYSLREAKSTIKLLKKNNMEIGLHLPDFNRIDSSTVKKEIRRITKYASVQGIRKHYLTDNFPRYINALNDSGINYDSTAGFRDKIGFKTGTSFPLWYGNVLEIPLLVMDSALMESGEDPGQFIKFIHENGGIFSVLFHNHILASEYKQWWLKIKDLIDEFKSKPNISMSGLDILNWRRQIDSLKIDIKKNKLIIETEKQFSRYPISVEYKNRKYRFFAMEANNEKSVN